MTLPTFLGATSTMANGAAISPTWVAGHQANDIGLMFVQTSNETIGTIPSGWFEAPNSPQGTGTAGAAGATRLTALWRRAESSNEQALSIGDSGNHQIGAIFVFRGCETNGSPFDMSAGAVQSSATTSVSAPGGTTTVDDCLIVVSLADSVDTTVGQLGSVANASLGDVTVRRTVGTTVGNGGGFAVITGTKATAGAFGPITGELTTESVQGLLTLALKPPQPIPSGTDASWVQPIGVRPIGVRPVGVRPV